MFFSLVMMIAVSVVAVFFALQNTEVASIDLFGYPLTGKIGVLFLGAVAVGLLVGVLVMTPGLISRNITIARYRRRLVELEQLPPEDVEPVQ